MEALLCHATTSTQLQVTTTDIKLHRSAYGDACAQLNSDISTIKNIISTLPKLGNYKEFSDIRNSSNNSLKVLKSILTSICEYENDTNYVLESFVSKLECYPQMRAELANSIQRNELLLATVLKTACPRTAKVLFKDDIDIFKTEFFKEFFVTFLSIPLNTFVTELSEPSTFTSKFVTAFADFIKYFQEKAYDSAYTILAGGKIGDTDIEGILTIDSTKVFGMCESGLLDKKHFVAMFKYIFELSKLLIVRLARSKQLTSLYKATKLSELKTKAEALKANVDTIVSGFKHVIVNSGYNTATENAWFTKFTDEKAEADIDKGFYDIKTATTKFVEELSALEALIKGSGEESVKPEALEAFSAMCKTLLLEERLLDNIRRFDEKNEFYYNLKVEDSLAIEFNENNDDDNTLMNPRFFYDVNNVNNSFVVSKIDIKYLDSGLQIARSSRLN